MVVVVDHPPTPARFIREARTQLSGAGQVHGADANPGDASSEEHKVPTGYPN